MMTTIDCTVLGKTIAHSDDTAQSEILNAFGYELKVACKKEFKVDAQLCSISDKLDKNGIDLIKGLAEFIELREKNKP